MHPGPSATGGTSESRTPDLLNGILARADDPAAVGAYVVAEVRRAAGASGVALLECVTATGPDSFHLVSADPEALGPEVSSAPADELCHFVHGLSGPFGLWTPAADGASDAAAWGATVVVRLDLGTAPVGAVLALGVPEERRAAARAVLEPLALPLALVVRNAVLRRQQADLIEEKTRQLRDTNEALRHRELEYRTLAENQADLIMRFDRQGRYLYVNAATERVFGIPRGELLGKSHRELGFPEPLCRLWSKRIGAVLQTGRPVEEEFSLPNPGGDLIFNWRLFPEPGPGQVDTVLSVARDVTEHRRAEQSYRQLFESMIDGFAVHEILCDAEGEPVDYRFLSVNPAYERMTGLRAQDLIGRTAREVMPDAEPEWVRLYGKVALTGEPAHFVQESRALGKSFEVEAFRPTPGQFAAVFADITERVQGEREREDLESRLRQAQKMEAVGTLAGGIAHDFNNILTPIMAHTDLARMTLPDDHPVQADLQAVLTAAERAARLVRQILALSRRKERSPSLISLTPLVKEALKLLRSTFPSTIEIREEVDAEAGPVLADPAQLHQVLLNLCTNARDAMEAAGGVLTVRIGRVQLGEGDSAGDAHLPAGPYTTLSVSDTGPGIAPDVLDRIFEPYFTTKDSGTGTGFGLAVVHGIVRLCGGEIVVTSALGKGSTFEVRLPERTETSAPAEARPKAPLIGGRGRVLFVDDEDSIVLVGGEILRRLGYDVTAVLRSDEALALFRRDPWDFDVVVTDQTMPKITGIDLARQVREVRADLPVVITTGFSEQLDEERAAALGLCGLLTKPFTPSTLGDAVKRALAQARSHRGEGPRLG